MTAEKELLISEKELKEDLSQKFRYLKFIVYFFSIGERSEGASQIKIAE